MEPVMEKRPQILIWLALALSLFLSACGGSSGGPGMPNVKHVFTIVLENKSYDEIWGPTSQATYLSQTLRQQGALLTNYYGVGHVSLGNYVAMMSGQPLNPSTQFDCQKYTDFVATSTTGNNIQVGDGCVYPASVKTLPDQLTAAGKTWKGYMEDMGNTPTREEVTCGRPLTNGAVAVGATDGTQSATAADQYAARHNPFVYFHSLIDSGDCAKNVVALGDAKVGLAADLALPSSQFPNFSFITPNLCNDAHDGSGTGAAGTTCKNGDPGGLTTADVWLKKWIPAIMASPAYQDGGLIIIQFDEGDLPTVTTGTPPNATIVVEAYGDSCCNQPLGPNVTRPFTNTLPYPGLGNYSLNYYGVGGDRMGALMLSPYITAGTITNTPYNHYSYLASLEKLFGITTNLGYAGQSGLVTFGSDIFKGYSF
jgi:hypothetical protein